MIDACYSESDLETITALYPDIEKLMVLLPSHSKSALRRKASELGLTVKRQASWSVEEDDLIRQNPSCYQHLQKLLPHRTFDAIKVRARKLGVRKKNRRWTKDQISVMRQLAGKVTDAQAAEILGGSRRSVAHKRLALGLACPASETGPAKVDIIQDLFDAAEAKGLRLSSVTRGLGLSRMKRSANHQRISAKVVASVVGALGGELYVEWMD